MMNRNVIETQLFSEEYNDEKRRLPDIVLLDMRPLLLYTFGHDKEKGPGCANSQRVRRRGRQLHHAALHPLAYLSISLQSHTRKDVRCSHATKWSPVLGILRGYKIVALWLWTVLRNCGQPSGDQRWAFFVL